MSNTNLMQVEAIRKKSIPVQEFYIRVMEGIHSLGEKPSRGDVNKFLGLLKNLGCKSLSEIKENEEEFELSKEYKIEKTDMKTDVLKGGIRSAKFIIGSLLENPDSAINNLSVINQPAHLVDRWLHSSESSRIIKSSQYQFNKASDIAYFVNSKECECR